MGTGANPYAIDINGRSITSYVDDCGSKKASEILAKYKSFGAKVGRVVRNPKNWSYLSAAISSVQSRYAEKPTYMDAHIVATDGLQVRRGCRMEVIAHMCVARCAC